MAVLRPMMYEVADSILELHGYWCVTISGCTSGSVGWLVPDLKFY